MHTLEKHFDAAFTAPNGIKKLRELILQLAMQGKLVPQNSSDQPASALLKDIEAEKKRLVKTGKIKAPKPLPPIKPDETPYALPKGWEWVRFGQLAQHNSGKTLDRGRNTGQLRDYITTSNLYWGRFELDNLRQMPIRDEEREKCTAQKGDLLICEGGEAGRTSVWPYDSEVCFQNHVHRARFYCNIAPHFGFRFFEKLNATGEINKYRKGVGISNMSSSSLASIIIPLPPLAEQRRIVAKIDQLMARCDELEKLKTEREQKRDAVHFAALNRLLTAASVNDFTSAWHFITQNFSELYSVKENVAELRKTILTLAMQGKLVPQDPSDQPASALLKEIETEKKRLIKEGKIKTPKPLPSIKLDETPHVLPEGWERVRFGTIATIERGGSPRPIKAFLTNGADGLNWIKIGDTDQGGKFITSTKEKIRPDGLSKTRMVYSGDFLLTNSMSFGRPYITQIEGCIHDGWLRISPPASLDKDYLFHMLSSSFIRQMFEAAAAGAVVQNLNSDKVRELPILIPPLAEQRRIVAKIDQLMALCDELEKQIDGAASTQTDLLNAIMAQV